MIVFSSVSKQFLPDSYALKDISFEIDHGELILLTGPSGSGKTTVMKLLTKEYNPTQGDILFHKSSLNDIKNSRLHEHRRKIGVVFQDYKLIPELNIWENIALPLSIIGKQESEIEERVTDLLELVSLSDKAFHFPKQLSGGEAQRISIARALSTAPAIVFADEPTGNLDKANSLLIAKLLSKINELGTTVLFSTHDHDVIDLFKKHRHIILNNGELVSDSGQKNKPNKKEEVEVKDTKEDKPKTEETKPDLKSDENKPKVDETSEDKTKITIDNKPKPQKISFWASLFGKKKEKISLEGTEDQGEQLELDTNSDQSDKTKVNKDVNSDEDKKIKDSKKTELESKNKKTSKDKTVKSDPEAKAESQSRKKTKNKNTGNKS
jgi:cell division transport system ATP-binding protein